MLCFFGNMPTMTWSNTPACGLYTPNEGRLSWHMADFLLQLTSEFGVTALRFDGDTRRLKGLWFQAEGTRCMFTLRDYVSPRLFSPAYLSPTYFPRLACEYSVHAWKKQEKKRSVWLPVFHYSVFIGKAVKLCVCVCCIPAVPLIPTQRDSPVNFYIQ